MLKLALGLALLVSLAQPEAATASHDEGGARGRVRRMIGGEIVPDAQKAAFSFEVAIRPLRSQAGGLADLPVCSGILIQGADAQGNAKYYVLTSGQCVKVGTTFNVWAGTTAIQLFTPPDATVSIDDVIFHEGFLASFVTDDLALFPAPDSIKTLIEATIAGGAGKTVTVATLPNVDELEQNYVFSGVTMAGWGYPNDVFPGPSPQLRRLSAKVVANFYCVLRHVHKPIGKNHICTGGLVNKGPCTGDSGAPLILDDRVIGLATMVPENGCSRGHPGVFTRLGNYLDWIASVTNYDVEQ